MKKILVFLFTIIAVGSVIYLFYLHIVAPFAFPGKMSDDVIPPTETPVPEARARFFIYTNNTKRIFTETKYHNRSSAAFITRYDPSEIIVKIPGTTWQAFFSSLPSPMNVSSDCLTTGTGQTFCTTNTASLSFYLNGKKVTDVLEKPIRDGDTLLISYGVEQDAKLQLQDL